MIQITYWGLVQYKSPTAMGAAAGLVAQSRALLLRNWRPERDFTYANDTAAGAENAPFSSNLYTNTNILPRQARDKHRES